MRVLDLFSGIGGFSLGLERAGMTTVAFCEIDPFCRAVLKKHWTDVPQFEDVRKLRGEDVGPVDLVCGGYPCQPFSTAGKRGGAEDDRHLWPEVRRLVEECRPGWVLCENVAGHISLGLDDVLSDLDALGYTSQAIVVPACAVNACHRRDRVWIIANSNSRRSERLQHKLAISGERGQGRAHHEAAGVFDAADAVRSRQQRQGRAIQSGDTAAHEHWEINRTEHVLGWPTEPAVRRADDGVSRRMDRDRLKALGNAVVPQVVEIIGRAIMRVQHD